MNHTAHVVAAAGDRRTGHVVTVLGSPGDRHHYVGTVNGRGFRVFQVDTRAAERARDRALEQAALFQAILDLQAAGHALGHRRCPLPHETTGRGSR